MCLNLFSGSQPLVDNVAASQTVGHQHFMHFCNLTIAYGQELFATVEGKF